MFKKCLSTGCRYTKGLECVLNFLAPVGDLLIRGWVAWVFFLAGLTKIQSWETTKQLFEHEYVVPLIPSTWAAFMGTSAELMLPVLLVLGLLGRIPALCLFFFNIVAVISYPFLLTEAGAVGLNDHFYWGVLLMVLMLHGPGKVSLDTLLCRWCSKKG